MRTDLPDIASSVSVVTEQFLRDTGATNSNHLLAYTPGTEVAGLRGSFATGAGALTGSSNITLRRWEGKAGYLDRLHRAAEGERYSVYL